MRINISANNLFSQLVATAINYVGCRKLLSYLISRRMVKIDDNEFGVFSHQKTSYVRDSLRFFSLVEKHCGDWCFGDGNRFRIELTTSNWCHAHSQP